MEPPGAPAGLASLYLEEHDVPFFLEDALQQVIALRPERPLEFMKQYFRSVLKGEHVAGRSFAFVSGCTRNRGAFARAVKEAYPSVGRDETFESTDLAQFCRFVCPDFPEELVEVGMAAFSIDRHGMCAFGTFVDSILPWFVFHEFMAAARQQFVAASVAEAGEPPTLRCVRPEVRHAILQHCYEGGERPRLAAYPPVRLLEALVPSTAHAMITWGEFREAYLRHPLVRAAIAGDAEAGRKPAPSPR